ncbi:hypothetical protein [Gynuella sp.]|uniref:phage tail tube protein n=1 Tax=Gynuella sp. TaxID=2969146 RepID=UPI003D0B3045
MARVAVYKPYLGSGQVYLTDLSVSNGPSYEIGNVSELKLSVDEEVIDEKDRSRSGGGTWAEVRRINSVTASFTMHDLNADNLALATKGTVTIIESGSVTDEAVTAWAGALVRLANPAPTSVVVTSDDGNTTYTETTDYEVRNEGLFIVSSGAIATAAASASVALKVNYSYGKYHQVEALAGSSTYWGLTFGGMNEADSDKPCIVDLHKVNIGAASELSLIGDELGTIAVEGKLLKDTSKGSAESAYYRVQMV